MLSEGVHVAHDRPFTTLLKTSNGHMKMVKNISFTGGCPLQLIKYNYNVPSEA